MRVGIYIRVSTEEQAKEGFSIEAQRRILNAWAVIKGASSVTEYVDEGYSAKNLNRPAVRRLIKDCTHNQLDTVIVWKTDRLTRNLRDLLMLMEDVFRDHNVQFVSSTESIDTTTPAGRLVLNMLGAVAQNERENTSERTSMVMRELSKTGRHMGGRPPYGYAVTDDGLYCVVPEEADAVRMLFDMRLHGASWNEIVAALHEHGYKPHSGDLFAKSALIDMIRNEKYTGVYIYNRSAAADRSGKRNNRASKPINEIIRVPGAIPVIVPHETWKAVNTMKKTNSAAVGGRNAAKNTYVLSGLVRCGVCGSNMVICNAGRNRDGSYWRAYRCKNKCVKGIEYKKLESCVFDYLSEHAGSDDFRTTLLTLAAEFNACAAEAPGDDAETARLAIAQKELERANIFRLAAMSANPPASLLDEIAQRDEEIAQLQRDLESAQKSAPRIDESALLDRLNTLIHIKEMPAQKQKAAVKEVVDAVTIFPDSIEISITTTASGGAEESRTPVRRPA